MITITKNEFTNLNLTSSKKWPNAFGPMFLRYTPNHQYPYTDIVLPCFPLLLLDISGQAGGK